MLKAFTVFVLINWKNNIKLINLFGSPGSGKSTIAAHIFSHLKSHNVKTELVGEFAKELIYLGNETQLVNQVYIMGCQYRKQKDLQRYGIDVAVSDSPLLLQLVYCRGTPYYKEICALSNKINSEFDNVNIFVNRVKPYQTYGRVNTEAESNKLAKDIWDSMKGYFHYTINGDSNGVEEIKEEMLDLANREIIDRF